MLAGMDAKAHVGGEDEGADVQRSTVGMGHPVLLNLHQGFHGLNKVVHGDLGDAHAVRGILHPLGIALRAEELNGVVHGAIGLHALKKLLGIVEHHRGGIHREGRVGDDAGVVPALSVGIVHQEHVV